MTVVQTQGTYINQEHAIDMFLHHLKLAVNFLETTSENEKTVVKIIKAIPVSDLISEKFRVFAATVATGCFVDFEWDEEQDEMKDDLPEDIKIIQINSPEELHNTLKQIFGE